MNQTDPRGSRSACRDSPLLVIQLRRICPAVVPMYEYKTGPHCFFFSIESLFAEPPRHCDSRFYGHLFQAHYEPGGVPGYSDGNF